MSVTSKHVLRAISLMFALCELASSQPKVGGTIAGKIQQPSGNPAAGATVLAILQRPATGTFQPWNSYANSDKDGSYRIADVPPGRIEICVDARGGDYVDICRWGRPASVATVTATGGVVTQNITLTLGKPVRIQFTDDNGYLERHEGKSAGAALDVGVLNEQRNFVAARLEGYQPGGQKIYRIVVPANALWRLSITGGFYHIEGAEESTKPLAGILGQDQDVKDAENGKEIVIRVKGQNAAAR